MFPQPKALVPSYSQEEFLRLMCKPVEMELRIEPLPGHGQPVVLWGLLLVSSSPARAVEMGHCRCALRLSPALLLGPR